VCVNGWNWGWVVRDELLSVIVVGGGGGGNVGDPRDRGIIPLRPLGSFLGWCWWVRVLFEHVGLERQVLSGLANLDGDGTRRVSVISYCGDSASCIVCIITSVTWKVYKTRELEPANISLLPIPRQTLINLSTPCTAK